jgi:hypothetical protein
VGLRDTWEFRYPVGAIAEANLTRLGYHNGRLEHWRAEREHVLADLRETGLEVRSHQVTGGYDASVVVDPEKAKWLGQVEAKIAEHQRLVDEHARWQSVLMHQPRDTTLDLRADDILFFGLAAEHHHKGDDQP